MNKYIQEELLELKANSKATHLRISLFYKKGGINVFTYENEPRGYYLSLSPVSREERNGVVLESYTAFSGYKTCLHEVTRQTKKQETYALEMWNHRRDTYLNWFLQQTGLEIAE